MDFPWTRNGNSVPVADELPGQHEGVLDDPIGEVAYARGDLADQGTGTQAVSREGMSMAPARCSTSRRIASRPGRRTSTVRGCPGSLTAVTASNIRHPTDVSACNLQKYL